MGCLSFYHGLVSGKGTTSTHARTCKYLKDEALKEKNIFEFKQGLFVWCKNRKIWMSRRKASFCHFFQNIYNTRFYAFLHIVYWQQQLQIILRHNKCARVCTCTYLLCTYVCIVYLNFTSWYFHYCLLHDIKIK